MAIKKDSRLKRAGVSGFNKPKRTPGHSKKSHVVVAKSGGKIKTIRLQADIKEAKELPEPPIGRTEYDLKDQMIRNTIIETEKDVQEIKEEQKEMRTDVKNIERMLMQK